MTETKVRKVGKKKKPTESMCQTFVGLVVFISCVAMVVAIPPCTVTQSNGYYPSGSGAYYYGTCDPTALTAACCSNKGCVGWACV